MAKENFNHDNVTIFILPFMIEYDREEAWEELSIEKSGGGNLVFLNVSVNRITLDDNR